MKEAVCMRGGGQADLDGRRRLASTSSTWHTGRLSEPIRKARMSGY